MFILYDLIIRVNLLIKQAGQQDLVLRLMAMDNRTTSAKEPSPTRLPH